MKSVRISLLIASVCVAGVLFAHPAHGADPKTAGYLADAQARFEKRDFPGAIIQLKNALQIDGGNVPALVLLGKSLLRESDPVGAEVTLNQALAMGASRAEVLPLLGQAYLALGKHRLIIDQAQFNDPKLPGETRAKLLLILAAASADIGENTQALAYINQSRSIDPHSPDSWLAEVPVRMRMRQFKEANAAIERATAMAPDAADTWYQKGSVLHVAGNVAGALAAYDKAIKTDNTHLGALLARVGIYFDQKRNGDASKDLDEIKRVSPDDPRAAYLRALLAERENKPAQAREYLVEITELLDKIPLDYIRFRPQILMLNGLAHFGLNEPEKAKVYFEAFQKVQPDAPTAKLLGQIYLRSFNYDRAVDVLERYLKAHPTDGQGMTLLGSALMAKGQYARATTLMQQALQIKDSPAFHTVLGMSLMNSGQGANAIKELEIAFKNDPRQTQAATTLVTLYTRAGQPAKAVVTAEKLVKLQPANAGFLNLLGMVKGNAGNLAGARTAFESAVKISANFHQPKLNLARLDIGAKAYDAATSQLLEILKADPKSAEAMYELATIADRRGQVAKATEWLEKAFRLSGPRELRWGLALTDYHLRQGRAALALDVAKGVASKEPEDLSAVLALARAQLATKDIAGARASLNTATRVADYDPKFQVQIALLQVAAQNLSGANYSLDKALSKQPDFLPALALLTDLDLRQGDSGRAEKRAGDILAKYPKLAVGHGLLGDVALKRGQTAAALEFYRRAHAQQPSTDTFVRLYNVLASQDGGKPAAVLAAQWLKSRPNDSQAHLAVANNLARIGNYGPARAAYEGYLKINPNDAVGLNNLANVLVKMKDPQAVAVAERALAQSPSSAITTDTLGWALLQNGQLEKALKMLTDARTRDPANSEIRYHLGAALAQGGRKKEAREELDLALKSGQSFEGAAEAAALRKTLD